MAVTLSRGKSDQLHHLQKFNENEANDQQQQPPHKRVVVPVVYYLSRNGHLEHPHFMEVPLSSSNGLFLRDVILRLNLLRGKSMASHYSWSSKRSYKNGFVWHDLSEDDFIHPVHGGEYVLKGSEITTDENLIISSSETTSSSSNNAVNSVPEIIPTRKIHNNSYGRRRNQSWGAVDLHEYKVYKSDSTHDFAGKAAAADASTQTEDKRRRQKPTIILEEERNNDDVRKEQSTELSREEISPPPSDSSPETLESLMKSDGRLLTLKGDYHHHVSNNPNFNPTVGSCPSGRLKASSVLMSLISCGSLSFRDCGVAAVKDHGLSMMSNYKSRVPRGGNQTVEGSNGNSELMMEIESNVSSSFAKMALEDKEYFSGSLIETKNKQQEIPTILKRSSSYNADRSLHLKLEEKEDGVRAKCIPRKLKSQTSTSKKDSDAESTRVSINSTQERIQDY